MNQAQTVDANAAPLRHPAGLWVLIFTETWERFSHYGMRALLILYLTAPIAMGGMGLDKARAGGLLGGYLLSIYLFSINGGQIADRFLGAKRTIVMGGLFIAAGQLLLQVKSMNGLVASLVLIAIGTCLLKPNISASVGRLYSKEDPRRDGAFTIEYMGINIGATVAPLICGFMAESASFHRFLNALGLNSTAGWSWAFGVSGFGMLLGLLNFILRRKHIKDVSQPEGTVEAKPVSLPFVAALIAILLGLAWIVVSGKNWPTQLIFGAVAAGALMTVVQMMVNRGMVKIRAQAAATIGAPVEHPKLTKEELNRLLVVFMMLLFSISFWFVFQQAGSTLTLFAKEYTNRITPAFSFHISTQLLGIIRDVAVIALGLASARWIMKGGKDGERFTPRTRKLLAASFLVAALAGLLVARGGWITYGGGFEIPASWFQTVNAFFIVLLGPVFVWIWTKRAGRFPSSPVKFALGLLFAALGFFLLAPAAWMARPTPADAISKVNMSWLMGVYLLHTIGELCISPVGLSYVSRLAPKHLTSQMMGAWFFSLGIGAYLAGKAAGFMDSVPLYLVFLIAACIALGMSFLLWFVVSRIINKLMGGHS